MLRPNPASNRKWVSQTLILSAAEKTRPDSQLIVFLTAALVDPVGKSSPRRHRTALCANRSLLRIDRIGIQVSGPQRDRTGCRAKPEQLWFAWRHFHP